MGNPGLNVMRRKMKMLKRTLIAIAIVALLASEANAVDLCTIPVFMNFGKKAKAKKSYFGCEDFHIRANFPVQLGLKYSVYNIITNKNWDVFFEPEDTIPGDGNFYEQRLSLMISKVKMAKKVKVPPGSIKVLIGKITITYDPPVGDHLIEFEENPEDMRILLDKVD